MASLPPGWEPDYDGSRWLYRYTPTGLTQFTFPKPGDEFPEFVAPGAGPIVLAPEERLASERQIKLRKKGVANLEEARNDRDRDGQNNSSFVIMSATGYFDPSEFMYYEGGGDDGELTPIAGKEDNQLRYPLGFVAELPSSDTTLCADELAPVELDAGQYESIATTSRAATMEKSLNMTPLPPPTTPSAGPKSVYEDDIYSADVPSKTQSNLNTVSSPPSNRGNPRIVGTEASAGAIKTRKSESPKPANPIIRPVSRLPAETRKPTRLTDSHIAVSAVPLVSTSSANHSGQKTMAPGRSVDDIQAMPSSLQAQQPLTNRLRSKSATHEPWRPSIKFVQTGLMQESQVSTPALSANFALSQQSKDLSSIEDTRMSAWLVEQALARPPSKAYEAGCLDLDSLEQVDHETIPSVQHHQLTQKGKPPALESLNAGTDSMARTTLLPPLPLARELPKDGLAEQGDRVVETIINLSSREQVTTPRGVQLVDVSPGVPKSNTTRRGATKKRFSWESEADILSDETTGFSTAPEDPTPRTPTKAVRRTHAVIPPENDDGSVEAPPPGHIIRSKERIPQSVASVGRDQDPVVAHASPKTSLLSSPRLPFETNSPTHGHITANKIVVVKPKERKQASIATIEAGLRKPLPPLPLAPQSRSRSPSKTASNQSRSNAFEQMSELISVANAAMPSARPRSAVPPGPSAESVWRNIRTQASRSALSPNLTAASSSNTLTATAELPNRAAGHARSISQLTGTKIGLEPPRGHHTRSQSLMSTSGFLPTYAPVSSESDRLPQALATGNTVWPELRVIPAPTDGHKSHKRLSIHTTPAGIFQYHPLRSSPVFASTSNAPETEEPQSVDYLEEQTSSYPQLKPKSEGASKTPRTERPRLQVKSPFVGLPSSPRPLPKTQPQQSRKVDDKVGVDEPAKRPVLNEEHTVEHSSPVVQRRHSTQSQVSSPTSSIFSNLRDSSVSATSSMADPDATPLSELGADIDKSSVKCVQYGHPAPVDEREPREKLVTESAESHRVPSRSSTSPSEPSQAKNPQTTSVSSMSVQRPPNVSEAIRPAGTRASLWGPAKIEDEPTGQPLIPTVVVRAPTVKLRHWERQITRDEPPEDVPHMPELQVASPERDDQHNTTSIKSPARPAINIVPSNEDVETQSALPSPLQGFVHSLRKSWQFTTSNAPRLSMFSGQGHTRSRSQSALPEPSSKVDENVAAAAKWAVGPWQWSDRDKWPSRDSLPVDTGSISNVEATIRFFNSSFQARRSKMEDVNNLKADLSRANMEKDSRASTIVVRKVGPPVVVRMAQNC